MSLAAASVPLVAEWSLVGRDSDPVPASETDVDTIANEMASRADSAREVKDVLKSFHERIGLKTEAYEESGWNDMLQSYFRPQIDRALVDHRLAHQAAHERQCRSPVADKTDCAPGGQVIDRKSEMERWNAHWPPTARARRGCPEGAATNGNPEGLSAGFEAADETSRRLCNCPSRARRMRRARALAGRK